jgi:geranylgeranyl diphosphate synthase type II
LVNYNIKPYKINLEKLRNDKIKPTSEEYINDYLYQLNEKDLDKNLVKELSNKLEKYINSHSFGVFPSELYDPVVYVMKLGSKRIRPLFCLLAYGMYGKNPVEILSQSVALEVFHNFTLVHDDIMDKSPLRRGKPTVHEKWNSNIAILSGDVMMILTYDLLLSTPTILLPTVIRNFSKTVAEVCEGQQLDMNFEGFKTVSEEDYINMIRLKTAVLVGYSLQLGVMLAEATKEDIQCIYDCGVQIGLGFQLQDDLMDVYADQTKFGKQVGGDIISNKKTFLLIKALELAKGKDKEELQYWLDLIHFDKGEKVDAVTSIYDKLGIRFLTEKKMQSYFDKGVKQLEKLHIKNNSYYTALIAVTQELIHREK